MVRLAESAARHAAGIARLLGGVLVATARGRVAVRDVVEQAYSAGTQSLPLVVTTAVLSGVVTAQQSGYQFTGQIPLYIVGSVVTASMVLELGPVVTSFVLIGRVGARITAELGTMRVSEQIDALESLGRDPIAMLAAPRFWGSLLTTPLLVGVADATGVFAGMLAAQRTLGLPPARFLYGVRLFWHDWDLVYSLTKAIAFGVVIPVVGSHVGLSAHGGAEGVGRASTRAVVAMILTVLVLDALFPPLLLR